uniref:RecA family profile 1 domain-containing protein n=1 Tax=Dunaliella tertiolecta TaxID=3047 RepID=A0A7S3R2M7_DUNTE|mmetsp:Transcript_20319/g.56617  ORF Transcript_20319/g.56617 Transcript_20319/m.56617 type:complete len:391 (+) Transcript_20319:65-1237(+)|eukprot:CAMPEP_0202388266 /NCGR_PEP_ID=MMETSP1127-20130417/76560_1 /ASSEMBLY_ACC=CAM_ASM_000462 /TAXON_ID=3047 /ORGANISM="Dunaliella tertiolecta, Strain CCMP1320" /LENGTH=390 /DNA_ID=CAMNT_0048989607 /DNA_START=123 /DNA_END=1295 /DNA_ORIENTATION=+
MQVQKKHVVSLSDPHDQQLLHAHSLENSADLMMYTALDLSEVMNISMGHAQRLLTAASASIAPAYVTAAGLLQRSRATVPLATGLPDLDHVLRRGIPVGAISEFVGPAGVGKSQLCLMLTLLVAGPAPVGREASVVYIDTENKFSGVRLAEMARERLKQQHPFPADEQQQQHTEAAISAMMSRILLVKPSAGEELIRALHGLEAVVSGHGVKLVVVDSIAAQARSEMGGGMASMVARQEMLGLASSLLKSVAETYQIPVVATNQVSARIGDIAGHAGAVQGAQRHQAQSSMSATASAAGAGQQGLGAALGILWAHCVNLRLVLERVGDRRFIKLVKSPISANVSVEYAVMAAGLVQVGQGCVLPPSSVLHVSIADEREHRVDEAGMHDWE